MKTFWKGFLLGAVLCVISFGVAWKKFVFQPDIALGKLEVFELNGKKTKLTEFVGKPLVINYWATWCAPCIQEFPHFERIKQEYGDKVSFIMISDEAEDKIRAFSSKNSYSFKYLRATKPLSESEIQARPTSIFYNSKGELIDTHIGGLDARSLKELVESIL